MHNTSLTCFFVPGAIKFKIIVAIFELRSASIESIFSGLFMNMLVPAFSKSSLENNLLKEGVSEHTYDQVIPSLN